MKDRKTQIPGFPGLSTRAGAELSRGQCKVLPGALGWVNHCAGSSRAALPSPTIK